MRAPHDTIGQTAFDRCNLSDLVLDRGPQHGGRGEVCFQRIASHEHLAGACNYIDYAEIPPGCTIGRHRHGPKEEEMFLILEGEGEMARDDEIFVVRTGDLVRNPPGSAHGLSNTGKATIRLFVFQLEVTR